PRPACAPGTPGTGAFVGRSEATLTVRAPAPRARGMAGWTLAGSFGYVGGPLLLAAALGLGLGWRSVTIALGAAAVPLALVLRRRLPAGPHDAVGLRHLLRETLVALRRREVLRWLAVLEAADLMLDVLHGFL